MLYGCNFEKIHFLSKIDTNTRVGRDQDTLWTKSIDGIFIILQMKVFGHNFFLDSMHGIKSAKLAISKVALLILCMECIIQKQNLECIWPSHLLVFLNGVIQVSNTILCNAYRPHAIGPFIYYASTCRGEGLFCLFLTKNMPT